MEHRNRWNWIQKEKERKLIAEPKELLRIVNGRVRNVK